VGTAKASPRRINVTLAESWLGAPQE
jgi:hypothetical protein